MLTIFRFLLWIGFLLGCLICTMSVGATLGFYIDHPNKTVGTLWNEYPEHMTFQLMGIVGGVILAWICMRQKHSK